MACYRWVSGRVAAASVDLRKEHAALCVALGFVFFKR